MTCSPTSLIHHWMVLPRNNTPLLIISTAVHFTVRNIRNGFHGHIFSGIAIDPRHIAVNTGGTLCVCQMLSSTHAGIYPFSGAETPLHQNAQDSHVYGPPPQNQSTFPWRDVHHWVCMMTSSNGNIFRVTGLLCGEFTGRRWIPHTKASNAEL